MKIPVLVLQKTSAVFIDISAHGPAIQVSHDRVAVAAVCRAFERAHRVLIEFFLHLYSPGA